ncbi:MAG: hypothetical protein KGS44_04145 [Alphaproteobacteria bacterium]|jgi:hypothetical protein|nr:hypothetical protein [Alphaproteobacteria bacterium]
MVRAFAAIMLCALLWEAAEAQRPDPACLRPTAPSIPDRASLGMTLEQLVAINDQRDAYVAAADAYRLCLDLDIGRRQEAMVSGNAPADPMLQVRAEEHNEVSAERAEMMGRFVLMCLSWENINQTSYSRGCYLDAED